MHCEGAGRLPAMATSPPPSSSQAKSPARIRQEAPARGTNTNLTISYGISITRRPSNYDTQSSLPHPADFQTFRAPRVPYHPIILYRYGMIQHDKSDTYVTQHLRHVTMQYQANEGGKRAIIADYQLPVSFQSLSLDMCSSCSVRGGLPRVTSTVSTRASGVNITISCSLTHPGPLHSRRRRGGSRMRGGGDGGSLDSDCALTSFPFHSSPAPGSLQPLNQFTKQAITGIHLGDHFHTFLSFSLTLLLLLLFSSLPSSLFTSKMGGQSPDMVTQRRMAMLGERKKELLTRQTGAKL